MGVDILAQAAAFGQAVLAGGALGFVYDGLRALRRQFGKRWLAFGLDLLFWLGTTVLLFAFALTRGDGQIQVFHVAALLLGGTAYLLTLSRLTLPLLMWAAGGLAALGRLATAPARQAGRQTNKFLK